jgi:hypothetical protein
MNEPEGYPLLIITLFASVPRDAVLRIPNTRKTDCGRENSKETRRQELELFKNIEKLLHRQ